MTPESFQHAFKEENYERNFEFLKDMFFGLVVAFFHEFKKSEFFPTADCMADCPPESEHLAFNVFEGLETRNE